MGVFSKSLNRFNGKITSVNKTKQEYSIFFTVQQKEKPINFEYKMLSKIEDEALCKYIDQKIQSINDQQENEKIVKEQEELEIKQENEKIVKDEINQNKGFWNRLKEKILGKNTHTI